MTPLKEGIEASYIEAEKKAEEQARTTRALAGLQHPYDTSMADDSSNSYGPDDGPYGIFELYYGQGDAKG